MNFATLPVVIYIGWWANHMIHHRGQLSTYLRAMNAHVPSIYGGSADEPFEWRRPRKGTHAFTRVDCVTGSRIMTPPV